MDIHHLQHFLAVVETGSFHSAAQRLNLTQQAVSRSVKSLEAELGVRLLERKARDRRKVSPTAFGALLLPRARAVVQEMQGLRDHFHNLLGHRHTLVRFAATPTALRRLVPGALRRFHALRPGMRVQVMQAVLPSIATRLAEGAYDFILADDPPEPWSEAFRVEPIFRDRCVIVCGRRHPLSVPGARIDPATLRATRWLGFGPFVPSHDAEQAVFAALGITGSVHDLETSSLELVLAELRHGDCVCVLPEGLVAAELAAGELVILPVALPERRWAISVVSLADQPRSTASDSFVECLRAAAATGAAPG